MIKWQCQLQSLDQATTLKSQTNITIKILLKLHLQNLNLTSTLTKLNFKVSTKHQQCWFSIKISTKLQHQSIAWASISKYWPNLVLKVWTKSELRKTWPNFSFHIFSKLASTRFSALLIINSKNFHYSNFDYFVDEYEGVRISHLYPDTRMNSRQRGARRQGGEGQSCPCGATLLKTIAAVG